MTAWVLVHSYWDGSAFHVERVYLDKVRAEEDLALAKSHPQDKWELFEVPVTGESNV